MLAGVPVHLIQRGNNRAPCFVTAEDRSFYLFHLSRALGRFGCELHAYCLMTNHVHLLLTPKALKSCGLLMKHMGQLHSQYFNKLYKRTGSLWEGRFRSCLVQSERYLLTCYCYIELNPVRAGLVARPVDYPWSSHAENLGGTPSGLLTPHPEYLALGTRADDRVRAYAGLIACQLDGSVVEQIRAATNGGYALGNPQFQRSMSSALGRRVEKGRPGRPARPRNDQDEQTAFSFETGQNVVCP